MVFFNSLIKSFRELSNCAKLCKKYHPKIKKNLCSLVLSVLFSASLVLGCDFLSRFCCFVSVSFADKLHYLVGYFFAIMVGLFSIELIRRPAMRFLEEKEKEMKAEEAKIKAGVKTNDDNMHKPNDPQLFLMGDVIGIAERLAYVSAFLAGQPVFAGVWLGVKLAMSFKRYETTYCGREMFNVCILNNLLSLMYAFVGWKIIEWCSPSCPFCYYSACKYDALYLVLVIPVFCLVLLALVCRNIRAANNRK